MNVSLIGSGNLAWHLAQALDNTEYAVTEVFSRNAKNAKALVERLYDARAKDSLDFSSSSSRIFILAVTDDALEQVAAAITLPRGAVLVHTSGSKPLSILASSASDGIGVFYPLQTFTKNKKVNFSEVPVFIEGADRETESLLLKMGRAISEKVHSISSAQRMVLHLAAVFASNFTNHMLAISADLLAANKLDFEWLKPVIAETINKSLSIGPDKAQTGPARRGDLEILDTHLEFLQYDEAVAEIYRVVSQHILDRYGP